MKTISKRTSAALLLAAVMTMGLMAQGKNNGQGNRQGWNSNNTAKQCLNIPDLTEDQKSELEALRMDRMQESQTYRNHMGELRARQRTLMNTVPFDQKAMDKLVDEKTTLTNKHLKAGNAQKAAVSKILTKEQQVYLNQMKNRRQHFGRRGAGQGYRTGQGKGGHGYGYHARQGQGMRSGAGRGYNANFRGQNW